MIKSFIEIVADQLKVENRKQPLKNSTNKSDTKLFDSSSAPLIHVDAI